ncbi:MAG: hypothetical protein JWP41_3707 [Ramlibacter sp.]|nr:hypothetical protein [Ramlibacter sp.]
MPNTKNQSEQAYDRQDYDSKQAPRSRDDGGKPDQSGQPSPGLKDKDAVTSNSYGDTRESGEEPKG